MKNTGEPKTGAQKGFDSPLTLAFSSLNEWDVRGSIPLVLHGGVGKPHPVSVAVA